MKIKSKNKRNTYKKKKSYKKRKTYKRKRKRKTYKKIKYKGGSELFKESSDIVNQTIDQTFNKAGEKLEKGVISAGKNLAKGTKYLTKQAAKVAASPVVGLLVAGTVGAVLAKKGWSSWKRRSFINCVKDLRERNLIDQELMNTLIRNWDLTSKKIKQNYNTENINTEISNEPQTDYKSVKDQDDDNILLEALNSIEKQPQSQSSESTTSSEIDDSILEELLSEPNLQSEPVD